MKQKDLDNLNLQKAAQLLKKLSKEKHAKKIGDNMSEDEIKKIYKAVLQRTPYGATLSIDES